MESVQILLAGSTYLYRLFQNIFGNAPSTEQIDILTSDTTKDAFEIFRTDNNSSYEKGLEHLSRLEKYYRKDKKIALEKLTSEYNYLLIGPHKLPAPPWESVYRTTERLLFQESTLEVRRYYLNHSFIPAEYPHVADDHLALELDFMANLSSMTEKAYEEQDMEQVLQLLDEQKSFLKEHLLLWVPEFAERIQESPTLYLYPNMATMLKEFLEIQIEAIEEIKATI